MVWVQVLQLTGRSPFYYVQIMAIFRVASELQYSRVASDIWKSSYQNRLIFKKQSYLIGRDILNRVVNYVKRRCERNNLLCRPISTTNTTISRPFFKDKSRELVKVNNHSHFWIFCGPWFVAKTLQLSVYDCQLRTVVSLRGTEVSARGQSPSPLVWHHHMRHTVVQNSSGRQLV